MLACSSSRQTQRQFAAWPGDLVFESAKPPYRHSFHGGRARVALTIGHLRRIFC